MFLRLAASRVDRDSEESKVGGRACTTWVVCMSRDSHSAQQGSRVAAFVRWFDSILKGIGAINDEAHGIGAR